jgi:hypothetical protein
LFSSCATPLFLELLSRILELPFQRLFAPLPRDFVRIVLSSVLEGFSVKSCLLLLPVVLFLFVFGLELRDLGCQALLLGFPIVVLIFEPATK